MVLFDATTLLLLLSPNVSPPIDPNTGQPVTHAQKRIECLVEQLERDKTKVLIPTPALSEILVRAEGAAQQYHEILSTSSAFRIASFDERAAVEVAAMTREALNTGDKRGGSAAPWVKVKYDRQIAAIARVEGVTAVYSDDGDLRRLGAKLGINVVRLVEIPLPPEALQPDLPLAHGTEAVPAATTDSPSTTSESKMIPPVEEPKLLPLPPQSPKSETEPRVLLPGPPSSAQPPDTTSKTPPGAATTESNQA